MRTIIFNKDSLQQSSRTEEKPSIYLDKIIFKTTDENWVPKLFNTSLLIKIAGFDEKGKEIKSFQTPITIGAFISPQHIEPVFVINKRIQFPNDIGTILDSGCAYWTTTMTINNLIFNKKEELILFFEEKQKSTIVSLYQEFEKIVKQILEANKFKVSYEGKQYDFLAVYENTFAYVEVKLYQSRSPRLDLLKTACNKLYAQKDKPNAKLLLVMPNYVTQELKDEIFKEWGITVWDIKSLVALSTDFPEIYYSLEISFSNIVRGPIHEFISLDKNSKENIIANLKMASSIKKNQVVKSKGSSLCKELNKINPGKEEATDYENKCIEILKYLFDNNTDLALWQTQLSTDDGLNRNDLLCRIISYENNFWAELSNDFNSRYVVFEFKNYTKPIKQGQIFTTEKYLFLTALRSVSIIIARLGADENAMKAAKGALKEAGKLIVVINNQDVCEMLKYKDNGDDPSIVLRQKIDDILITINR